MELGTDEEPVLAGSRKSAQRKRLLPLEPFHPPGARRQGCWDRQPGREV